VSLSKQDAAQLLGMAEREVVSVKSVAGGHVVTTHDSFKTLVTDDGELVFGADAINEYLAPPEEDEPAAAAAVEAEAPPAKKAAPKKAAG
jgi:hypothetical protein